MSNDDQISDADVERMVGDNVDALDSPPTEVLESARAAFGMRSIDTRLAELADDQLVRGDQVAVAFDVADGEVSVEVRRIARAWNLTGTGPVGTPMSVRTSNGEVVAIETDETGYFDLDVSAAPGVVVRIEIGGSAPVVTPWMP